MAPPRPPARRIRAALLPPLFLADVFRVLQGCAASAPHLGVVVSSRFFRDNLFARWPCLLVFGGWGARSACRSRRAHARAHLFVFVPLQRMAPPGMTAAACGSSPSTASTSSAPPPTASPWITSSPSMARRRSTSSTSVPSSALAPPSSSSASAASPGPTRASSWLVSSIRRRRSSRPPRRTTTAAASSRGSLTVGRLWT